MGKLCTFKHKNSRMILEEVMVPYDGWHSVYRCIDCGYQWVVRIPWKRMKELGLKDPPEDRR